MTITKRAVGPTGQVGAGLKWVGLGLLLLLAGAGSALAQEEEILITTPQRPTTSSAKPNQPAANGRNWYLWFGQGSTRILEGPGTPAPCRADGNGDKACLVALSPGSAVEYGIGYMFNPYVGLEDFVISSSHTASDQKPAPALVVTANVFIEERGMRFLWPATPVLKFFARWGLNIYQLDYVNNVTDAAGNPQAKASSFYGSGFGGGLGVTIQLNARMSIEGAYHTTSGWLTEMKLNNQSGQLTKRIPFKAESSTVSLSFHF